MGVGETGIGETGVGEMGVGETGPNQRLLHWLFEESNNKQIYFSLQKMPELFWFSS